ncbi:MAG: hypothetical protein AB1393_04360 [Candidatus Edwardsbacteria bacterium]
MQKRRIFLVLIISAYAFSVFGGTVPGLDFSLGGYFGTYGPSLKILNEQVLTPDFSEIGANATFGGQSRLGLPIGLSFYTRVGYWKSETKRNVTNGTESYTISLTPLTLGIDYKVPLVPLVLKGYGGVGLNEIFGGLKKEKQVIGDYEMQKATGSATCFLMRLGLELVSLPEISLGIEGDYTFGKISSLTIKEDNKDLSEIGKILEYRNRYTGQSLPLPLELSGPSLRFSLYYHF